VRNQCREQKGSQSFWLDICGRIWRPRDWNGTLPHRILGRCRELGPGDRTTTADLIARCTGGAINWMAASATGIPQARPRACRGLLYAAESERWACTGVACANSPGQHSADGMPGVCAHSMGGLYPGRSLTGHHCRVSRGPGPQSEPAPGPGPWPAWIGTTPPSAGQSGPLQAALLGGWPGSERCGSELRQALVGPAAREARTGAMSLLLRGWNSFSKRRPASWPQPSPAPPLETLQDCGRCWTLGDPCWLKPPSSGRKSRGGHFARDAASNPTRSGSATRFSKRRCDFDQPPSQISSPRRDAAGLEALSSASRAQGLGRLIQLAVGSPSWGKP